MDEISYFSELLANSEALTPDLIRVNAILLFAAALAVAAPVALRRLRSLFRPAPRLAEMR
jgi:hypothetical protein